MASFSFNPITGKLDKVGSGGGGGGGITSLNGNEGTPVNASNSNIITSGTTALFNGAGSTLTLDFGLSNLILGSVPSNITIDAVENLGLGLNALTNLTSGKRNVALGQDAGTAYSDEEGNISLGAGVIGEIGENNTTRIGNASTTQQAIIAGITGSTDLAAAPVAVNSSGKLVSIGFGLLNQVLTSTGPGATPVWATFGSIDIAASAYPNADIPNLTGDDTLVDPLIFNATFLNDSAAYDTTTGLFTSSVEGNYLVTANVTLNNLDLLNTSANLSLVANGLMYSAYANPGACKTSANTYTISIQRIVFLPVASTAHLTLTVSGSTQTVGVETGSFTSSSSFCVTLLK